MTPSSWKAVLFGTLFAALSVVASVWIIRSGLIRVSEIRTRDRTLSVTGSAHKRVRSDKVTWSAVVSATGTTLPEAARALRASVEQTRSFVVAQRVPANAIQLSAVTTEELTRRVIVGNNDVGQEIIGYRLSQNVDVESSDVDLVTNVSRAVTELIERGVHVESAAPRYLYTQLAPLKIALISGAAQDARTRADQITRANGSRLGRVASARVGVVQVNAANQSEATWDGVSDDSSIDKDAFVTVSTVYYVDDR